MRPAALAGDRRHPVCIRGSRHVAPRWEPVPDAMGRCSIMLASGGYLWTIIRVEDRVKYMNALEPASIDFNIGPFAEFIAERVEWSMKKAA